MDRWKRKSTAREKLRQGESQKREDKRGKRSEMEKVRRKKTQVREKVGKSRIAVFFPMFCAPGGRKVGTLKRRVRSQLAKWEMKSAHHSAAKHLWKSNCTKHTSRKNAHRCGEAHFEVKCAKHTRSGRPKKGTPVWPEAHLEVKSVKTCHVRKTFGSWDVEKVHPVVARSTFGSENVQDTKGSDHFLTIRLPVDVEKVHSVLVRSTCESQTYQKLGVLSLLWFVRCRFGDR